MKMNRESYIYMMVVQKVLEDNILTLDESNLLDIITQNFNIDQETIDTVMTHFDGDKKIIISDEDRKNLEHQTDFDKERKIFKNVLLQALDDEKITKDELEILKVLRDLFYITKDVREQIYLEVREEIEKRYEEEHKDYMIERFQDWTG
jgi:hypothetical protein